MDKIIDVEDIPGDARSCIECISMAAAKLSREESGAIQIVSGLASNKIDEAIALLEETGKGLRARHNLSQLSTQKMLDFKVGAAMGARNEYR